MESSTTSTSTTIEDDPSKTVILFEFIPQIVYIINQKESVQKSKGVVMILMLNGDVFFYPINMNQLNQLPIQLQSNSPIASSSSSSNGSNVNKKQQQQQQQENNSNNIKNKYSKYNISLNLSQDHKVYSFNFIDSDSPSKYIFNPKKFNENQKYQQQQQEDSSQDSSIPKRYRKPRKVLLSHDKKLLLIIGCFYKGISSLTVYKILEEGPEYFQLIYYDSSFTFIDACFSSDSTMLVSILSRYPNFIFFLQLPNIKNISIPICNHPQQSLDIDLSNSPPTTSNNNNNNNIKKEGTSSTTGQTSTGGDLKFYENVAYLSRKVSFEPRKIGPLSIIGPIKNTFGKPYHMTHISSNPYPYSGQVGSSEKVKAFEYITWNDDGLGEYCFWNVYKESVHIPKGSDPTHLKLSLPTLKFESIIKLIGSILPDKSLLERENSPKNFIINMEFAPTGDLVMCIVRKENHDFSHPSNRDSKKSSSTTTSSSSSSSSTTSPQTSSSSSTTTSSSSLSSVLNGIGIQLVPSTFEKLNFNSSSSMSIHNIDHQQSHPSQQQQHGKLRVIGGDVSSQWVQLSDSMDISQILSTKWSHSLFFGSQNHTLPCAVVKGKGILEFITNNYYSQFTNISEDFQHHCSNFLQLGSYHRLWINNNFSLFLITMTPKLDDTIEWIKIFENSTHNSSSSNNNNTTGGGGGGSGNTIKPSQLSTDLIQMRYHKLSQMIGYHLFDLTEFLSKQQQLQQSYYSQYIQSINTKQQQSKNTNKGQQNSSSNKKSNNSVNSNSSLFIGNNSIGNLEDIVTNDKNSKGDGEIYSCLHLYKCQTCKKTLLKPLVCGGCKAMAYCSKSCQKEHWSKHQKLCFPPTIYLPPTAHNTFGNYSSTSSTTTTAATTTTSSSTASSSSPSSSNPLNITKLK